jgi:L-ascorbate metabolism protein UlaG (beta-lactamase superfamily)
VAALGRDTHFTWLGHNTWRIRSPSGKVILVDPFLTSNPRCPPDQKSAQAHADTDIILVSHGHSDHTEDLVPVARASGAVVVAIFDLTTWLSNKGLAHTSGMNRGGTQTIQGIRISLTAAVHSSSVMDHGVLQYLGEPCGFVIHFENGFCAYLACDTAVFGDMALIRELHAPDLAILPIGDHFTMGPQEAAKAAELLAVRTVIPCHYGTFPILTGTPDALRPLLPSGVELIVPEPGETDS